ncbi:hypothetical protein [Streptomonospora litoralis]|uniref:Uncharacterized protein n=1 Tax=Streptomonospora litoralis TaxID=2498135 RepID=A0A4V0ZJ83_9ACTN|nr:hypothetical protein [Streptomonospora litoralis]QBI52582.1 hypothetical protein EKD16_03860 [Streptomonospora litoralis]
MTQDGAGRCRIVELAAVVEGADDLGYRPAPEHVRELAEQGRTVLVRCAPPRTAEDGGAVPRGRGAHGAAAAVALASVYAWLGARVFATEHADAVRQAVDMVASVQGRRPPAVARRGLA